MNDNNHRKQQRHSISVDVMIKTVDITISATATNISRHGIGIQTLKSIPPGTQATITMNVPDEIILYTNLMWSQHTLIQNLDAYDMGFEIYAMVFKGSIHDEPSMREQVIQAILAKKPS